MDIKLTEAQKIKILNSDDIYGIMQRILLREDKIDQNREHFWVIGLMDELLESTQYVPSYVLEKRFKKEASEIAKRKEKVEIARQMKGKGMDVDTISEITGLTVEEVQKLRAKRAK
jgi:DNA repair protein RadC